MPVKTCLALCFFLCASAAAEDNVPSLELLEFLAGWEASEGQWVDPQLLTPPEQTSSTSPNEAVRDE